MDQDQIKIEHRQRIVEALVLGIRHTALLCPPIREFVEEVTSKDALDQMDLRKIKDRKRGLAKAEQNLLLAVEGLYRLHASNAWIASRDYEGLLILLWHGVAETLDMDNFAKGEHYTGDGPLQEGEQRYHSAIIRPLVQSAFEEMWTAAAEIKKRKDRERKLLKKSLAV
jgi:hypothetical protein